MKSKEEIEIEFSKAMTQAQELEDVAAAMMVLANNLSTREMTRLCNSFKGDNAEILLMKWRTLTSDMISSAKSLELIAKSIRTTADLIYKAEKSAIMLSFY